MKYLKLGDKASSFYDMATGLQISGKEIVKVSETYIVQGRKTKNALAGGHLVYATEEEYNGDTKVPATNSGMNTEALAKKFIGLYKALKTPKELENSFSKEELIALTEAAEMEVEKSDTKATLVEALINDLEESEKE